MNTLANHGYIPRKCAESFSPDVSLGQTPPLSGVATFEDIVLGMMEVRFS